jgi:ADP-ribose pyrophosphatase YjhB (NUDIX family)
MAKTYHKIIPAVYVLLRRGNKVMLLRRANTGYKDGMYSLPAGHLNGGETALAAVVREANEEVGLALNPAQLTLRHTMHRKAEPGNDTGMERLDLFFDIREWAGEPVNAEPHKCDELHWAALDNLPPDVIPEVRQALQHIQAGVPYSDFNF